MDEIYIVHYRYLDYVSDDEQDWFYEIYSICSTENKAIQMYLQMKKSHIKYGYGFSITKRRLNEVIHTDLRYCENKQYEQKLKKIYLGET